MVTRENGLEWKKCKYLGSMLDTEADITRRKQQSMISFNQMKSKLQSSELSLSVRMRLFCCYVTSVFMYNSEIWRLTKKLENDIDVFHRRLLRKVLNIRYPFIISNKDLYERTNEKTWSSTILHRRLSWTGHLLRLKEETPAWLAFKESNKTSVRKGQGNKLTYNKLVDNDLRKVNNNISIINSNIRLLARNQGFWRSEVVGKSTAIANKCLRRSMMLIN